MNEKDDVEVVKCRECGKSYLFDEETNLYEDMHDECARRAYPLSYAIRRKIEEYTNIVAARDVFGPEHKDCNVPESMNDGDEMDSIIQLFDAIGHGLAYSVGLDDEHHEILVEPCCSDTSWWVIIECYPSSEGWIVGGDSQVLFFRHQKAWELGGNESEAAVEEMLQGYKIQLLAGLRRSKLNKTLAGIGRASLNATEMKKLTSKRGAKNGKSVSDARIQKKAS